MTELAKSPNDVAQRTGHSPVRALVPWRRRVGGRFGVDIELPAGAYSDDTQLRLAASRAIRSANDFDVEAYSKVELPIWPTYAIGGGVATREAAKAVARHSVTWQSNFYRTSKTAYVSAGGNGAAMRIQPHVWASREGDVDYLTDVFANVLVTHGHSRAIVGALLHAITLDVALDTGEVPSPESWADCLELIPAAVEAALDRDMLRVLWLPTWEKEAGHQFKDEVEAALTQSKSFIDEAASVQSSGQSPIDKYRAVVQVVGGQEPSTRGSGTGSVVASLALAWSAQKSGVDLFVEAANVLGTDTDTVISMACSLYGSAVDAAPPQQPQDHSYIRAEAERLAMPTDSQRHAAFRYPDILRWTPPKSQLDSVGLVNGEVWLAGLGPLRPAGLGSWTDMKGTSVWEWFVTHFDQTLLVKRRVELRRLAGTMVQTQAAQSAPEPQQGKPQNAQEILVLEDAPTRSEGSAAESAPRASKRPPQRTLTLDEAIRQVEVAKFSPVAIGKMLLELSKRQDAIEVCASFAASIAALRRAQQNDLRKH